MLRTLSLLLVLCAAGTAGAAGAAGAAATDPRPVTLTLTPAHARVLVEEALAPQAGRGGSVRVRIDSLWSAGERVYVTGAAQMGPMGCALRLDGRPALLDNRVTLGDIATQTEQRWDCQMALGMARSYIVDALTKRPWDIAGRLARASQSDSTAGPRLEGVGCVRPEQIELTRVQTQAPGLRLELLVHERPAGTACP